MPWNTTRTASFYDKEVLKYASGLEVIKSVVIDANDISTTGASFSTGNRNVVVAGTLLKVSATNTKQVVTYNGVGPVLGVLARPVDILAQATSGVEAAPLLYHGAVFATSALVGFTQYASAVISSLSTCKFE